MPNNTEATQDSLEQVNKEQDKVIQELFEALQGMVKRPFTPIPTGIQINISFDEVKKIQNAIKKAENLIHEHK